MKTVLPTLFAALALLGSAGSACAQSAARPQVKLPDGPVRSVILKNCVSCHGIDDYAFRAMDRAGWQALLDSRHKQERGLKLPKADEALLLDYLAMNFGAESVAFPRNYVAREISEYFDNNSARVFLEGTCGSRCHDVNVFKDRKDVAGWRALVLDMRERGAKITDQNVEKLVEWLGRVRGTNPND